MGKRTRATPFQRENPEEKIIQGNTWGFTFTVGCDLNAKTPRGGGLSFRLMVGGAGVPWIGVDERQTSSDSWRGAAHVSYDAIGGV